MGELEKALLKSDRPSIFFEELRKMRQLSVWFPELEALIGLRQNPVFHPEGDAWTHTMQVLDEAAKLRPAAKAPLWFMLSALCHDLGKAVTTEEIDGVFHSYEHETKGLPLATDFLRRLTREVKLTQYVLNMVKLHMLPVELVYRSTHVKNYMRMFDRSLCPEDLLLLTKADYLGRVGPQGDRDTLLASYAEQENKLREMLALYDERMSRPYLMGRDLVAAGLEPGPLFTEALAYAHKLRLAGRPKEEQLRHAITMIQNQNKET